MLVWVAWMNLRRKLLKRSKFAERKVCFIFNKIWLQAFLNKENINNTRWHMLLQQHLFSFKTFLLYLWFSFCIKLKNHTNYENPFVISNFICIWFMSILMLIYKIVFFFFEILCSCKLKLNSFSKNKPVFLYSLCINCLQMLQAMKQTIWPNYFCIVYVLFYLHAFFDFVFHSQYSPNHKIRTQIKV